MEPQLLLTQRATAPIPLCAHGVVECNVVVAFPSDRFPGVSFLQCFPVASPDGGRESPVIRSSVDRDGSLPSSQFFAPPSIPIRAPLHKMPLSTTPVRKILIASETYSFGRSQACHSCFAPWLNFLPLCFLRNVHA